MMAKANDHLLRSAAGVLLGFVAFASINVLGNLAIHTLVGIDQLYEPGRFTPRPLFISLQLALAASAAMIAGFFCRRVAGAGRAVYVFAAIIFVLSLFRALFAATMPNAIPAPRTGGESAEVFQAETLSQQPIWLTLGIPPLLVAGILLGSWRRGLKPQT